MDGWMIVRRINYFVYITEWRSAQNEHMVYLIMGPTNNIHDLQLL